MAIKPIPNHYSFESLPSIYDEEATTALELAARTAAKVNEVITSQNELVAETNTSLDAMSDHIIEQDERMTAHEEFIEQTIPVEVERAVDDHIANGDFDRAIRAYANSLESRVDNLLGSLTEGSTTADAELIDIRIGANGDKHNSAGEAVRKQIEHANRHAELITDFHGVYSIPLEWTRSSGSFIFSAKPFLIPKDGLSVRASNNGPYDVNGNEGHIMFTVHLGDLDSTGKFVKNDTLTNQYYPAPFGRDYFFLPYIEGVYVYLRVSVLANGSIALNANNVEQFNFITDEIRAYTGKLVSGGNMIPATPGCVVRNGTSDFDYDFTMRGFWWKYCSFGTPLPLKHVKRAVCNPDRWMCAKVYHFDPVTRTTTFVRNMHYNYTSPVFGTECVIDFSEYGDNDYAILVMGRVPFFEERQTEGLGNTNATRNVSRHGLNISDITEGVYIEWVNGAPVSTIRTGSPVVQKNIDLLRNLTHKTVIAMYGDDPSETWNFVLGQDNFAGVFYGGGYARGMFYYNVSPVAYYTALLNQNSIAYGDADVDACGAAYGIMCSGFVSLLHGYPIPLSTFDFRYNKTIPYITSRRMNLDTDITELKLYDAITRGEGVTGHTVLVNGITNIGDTGTALTVLEAGAPATRENVFWYHNSLNYGHEKPEDWYKAEYDFISSCDPAYDGTIWDKANWVVPYTEPQKVMCSRGYGSVYVRGVNLIQLSVETAVNKITITHNGADLGTYVASDLTSETMNGYNIVDITHLCAAEGTYRIHNDQDEGIEEFHVVNVSDYTVSATLGDEFVTIHTNHPEKVKYLNIVYRFNDGAHAGTITNANFAPAFDSSGNMTLPAYIVTDIGTVNLERHDASNEWENFVNVVFNTDYDTNTFAIDAQGDVFN